jgi:hypothetical protein
MEQAATTGQVAARRLAKAAAKAALLLFIVGADCSNKGVDTAFLVQLVEGVAPEVSVRAVGQVAAVTPGSLAQRSVFVQCLKPGGPDAVTVLWYPPAGATSLTFPGVQPANLLGPPPYEFPDVPVSDVADPQAVASLTISYAAPAPPQPTGASTFVDVFTAVTAAGNRYSAAFADAESAGGASLAALARADGSAGSLGAQGLAGSSAADGGYSWWSAQETITPTEPVPLDQTLCQGWAELLQGGGFFVALRFPVRLPDATDVRSVPLPVVAPASAASAPRLELRATQPAPSPVFSVPLELRPDRLAFAENNLPQADGERWVTLAPSAQPAAACPADVTGEWDLRGDLSFDFGGTSGSCSECVIQEYLCYAGSSAPFFFTSGAATIGAQMTYQGAGTTCVGPIPLRLAGAAPVPPVTLEGAGLARTSANALVKLAHRLRGWLAPDGETAVDLSLASARGIHWRLYSDSALRHPIAGPVTISGSAQFDFWAATRLPFGFRGQDSLTVTATSAEPAGAQTSTSDHIWAGGWTAPPPVPELHAGSPNIDRGSQITVSGALPDGAYRLVVVPNGAYLPGTCYTGEVLAAVDVTVSDATLPPTVVWSFAAVGSYDILALAGSCGGSALAGQGVSAFAADDTRIVAGDDLSPVAGVVVRYAVHRHIRH